MNDVLSVGILGADKGWGKKFMELCDKISIPYGVTKEDMKNAGFRHCENTVFSFNRAIRLKDKYPVSFNLRAVQKNKDMIVLTDVDILDENFLQPHPCDKTIYEQSEEYLHMLKNKGVLQIED